MKLIQITIISLIFIIPILNCGSQNVFSEKDNIIELNATKLKDDIQSNKIEMPLFRKNGWVLDNIFPDIIGIPDTLSDINTYYFYFNFDQALLQAYNSKLIGKDAFESNFKKFNLGTNECINEYVKTFVVVVTGKSASNEKYYIIDSNNDLDMSNDIPIRINSEQQIKHTHKIEFERVINNKIKKGFTWITLSFSGNEIMFSFDEYTLCKFQFDTIKYEIRTFPSRGPVVNYGSPCFFKVINKINSDIQSTNFNEYIKLNKSSYRITCSEDGLKIKLSKEFNDKNKGSTQLGISPISFKTVSLKGESISFPGDFKNKIILLDFWATSCGPCVHDIKAKYPILYNKYGNDKFEIIGVANNTKSELKRFVESDNIEWIIIPDGENRKIQKLYNIYQFPTLFLINADGIIIAKDDELRGNKLESLLNKLIEIK